MNDKSYKVIISSIAANMLITRTRFIANVSEKAAKQFIEEFNNKTKSLEQFPEHNPLVIAPMIPEAK
jgi:hypothetical protein